MLTALSIGNGDATLSTPRELFVLPARVGADAVRGIGATSGSAAPIVVAIADGGAVFDGAGVFVLREFHQCRPPAVPFACVERALAELRCELSSLAYILRSSSAAVSLESRLDMAASSAAAAAASASSSAAFRAAATGSKYVKGLG